jgi:hypothetical protein
MDLVYYFVIDAGPVLVPAVLAGCWYAAALGIISEDTSDGIVAAG